MSKGVEIFDVEQFKSALYPWSNAVWLGLVSSEYCWLLPVTEQTGILIRSSIDHSGKSGGLGEDSIRLYPTMCRSVYSQGKMVWSYDLFGSADVRWVTRMKGWEKRLQDSIQKLAALLETAGECSQCGKPRMILKVKKEGENHGRWFAKCSDKTHKSFVWLDE